MSFTDNAPAPALSSSSAAPNLRPTLAELGQQLRQSLADRQMPPAAVAAHLEWARRFLFYHRSRHPADRGVVPVQQFLHHLAAEAREPAPRLTEARAALRFLIEPIVGMPLGELPIPRPAAGGPRERASDAQLHKLREGLRAALRRQPLPESDVDRGVEWARRFLYFHGLRHPRELSAAAVWQFLVHLALQAREPLPRWGDARANLLFFYRDVLRRRLEDVPVAPPARPPAPRPEPDLFQRMRDVLRARHYALRTEECYLNWVRRFLEFYDHRPPLELGTAEVEQFCDRHEPRPSGSGCFGLPSAP